MKFREKTCCNCGLDLTTVEPEDVREVPEPGGDGIDMVFLAACPGCNDNRIVVTGEPEPRARGGRRRVSELEPEPEP